MTRSAMLFQYGFRVFFASCAVYAVIVMIGWIGVFLSGWGMAGVQPLQWHAHEMIYGVTAAAIAGFLL
ncbi:MAG: NnrS family protein, partial [Candidatus Wenzhouxiangella sp. M2_3B_020]